MKHLTTLSLDKSSIETILDNAARFKTELVISSKIGGRSLALCFFENSTRTRLSFELAAKKLGMLVIDLAPEHSSLSKGETIFDTLKTIESLGIDCAIIRCTENNLLDSFDDSLKIPIISGGQGIDDHPTQALLDAFTIKEIAIRSGKPLNELELCLVGDIKHSRVATSNIKVLSDLGVQLSICAPNQFRRSFDNDNIVYYDTLEEAADNSDILMALRIQKERLLESSTDILSAESIISEYRINHRLLESYKKLYIMHPGPINWGVELENGLQNHPRLLANRQVANGVFVRMATLEYFLSNQ